MEVLDWSQPDGSVKALVLYHPHPAPTHIPTHNEEINKQINIINY